jgi:NodT family efflux transporter outer membrane factor (OMF) lipoprotein
LTVVQRTFWAGVVISVIGLAGCALGPDYKTPSTNGAPPWGSEPNSVASATFGGAVDEEWWRSFRDPELISLVARYTRQNIDLARAAERVQQSQAERGIAASQGLPRVEAQAQYARERVSPAGTLSLLEPAPGAPLAFNLWQDSLQSSWELDLFGRVRRAVEAAGANTAAAIEARHAVALIGLAELAQDYMELRGAQSREAITRHNLALSTHSLALVRDQVSNGTATTLDLANAKAQQATIASELPRLRETEARLINAMGLLLAEPPRALESELEGPAPRIMIPPSIPVGLPSELARRRPDIREAEARLHMATAQTGVAIASFYPDISLTGSFGLQGLQFANAFTLQDRFFSLGPTIDLPIFEGGRLRGTLRLRRSQQREAALAYRNTVLQAWEDVDDALTAYAEAQKRRSLVARAAAENKVALAAARQSFEQGATDFLNVISAQAALLRSEDELAQSDTEIETDLVGLYKALGGGWAVVDERLADGLS